MNPKLVTSYIQQRVFQNDPQSIIDFILGTADFQTKVLNDYALKYQAEKQKELDDLTAQQTALSEEISAISLAIK